MANHISLGFLFSISLIFSLLILCYFKEGHALEREETAEKHLHTIQISSVLPASVCSPPTKGLNKGASLKVVHKRGPCFESSTQVKGAKAPTLTQILSHDQSRVNSIQDRLAFNSGKQTLQASKATLPAKSGASLGAADYVVTVGLGTPKKDLSLIFDTGSDLTWIQCKPCVGNCYKQQEPIFDPTQSKSYSNNSCNSPVCSQLTSSTGVKPTCSGSTCVYGIQYGDGSFSIGYFAKERLTLTSTDVVDNFLFGCGENNRGLLVGAAGLIGLAREKLSIISQTSLKYGTYFSYCLPSRSSSPGYLTFGKSGISNKVIFTPFSSSQGTSLYFIDILAIYVGGKKLSISPTVFSAAGTVIDSGTVITRLPQGAYAPLRTTFRQLMTKYPMGQPSSILDTCYDFSNYTTVSIPKIGFLFGGNVRLDIDATGILYGISPSQFCLAFAPNNKASDVAIFGNVQQRTLDVVYDVAGGKLGFGPGGCA